MHKNLVLEECVERERYKLGAIDSVVARLLMPYWRVGVIYAFSGEVGAGKTTILKALLRQAGGIEDVVSPTYAYFCQYVTAEGLNIYHFDLYRVGSMQTFCEMEFDFLLKDPKNVVVIEWPGVIDSVLNERDLVDRVVRVDLRYGLLPLGGRLVSVAYFAKK